MNHVIDEENESSDILRMICDKSLEMIKILESRPVCSPLLLIKFRNKRFI
mgnify:CR=1 FL=1